MSAGSRKKRATRPWQDPDALRGVHDLLEQPSSADAEIALDGYEVKRVDAYQAAKDYVCPECGNVVPRGDGHVVVWPQGDADLRRHWHKHCWRAEVRRSTGRGNR